MAHPDEPCSPHESCSSRTSRNESNPSREKSFETNGATKPQLKRSSSDLKIKRDFNNIGASKTRRFCGYMKCMKDLLKWLDWYEHIEEPDQKGWLSLIVTSSAFENVSSMMILLNCGYTAYSSNWSMQHLGEAPTTFMVGLECGFLAFYTVELLLRIETYRWYFFGPERIKWHMFDLILVCISIWDVGMTTVLQSGGGGGGNVSFMRILRLFKLAKIFRTLRVMKVFTDLAVILDSFRNSFHALFWCFVMLAFMIYMFALIFLQGMTAYLEDGHSHLDEEAKAEVLQGFGDLPKTMLTMYMSVTGGLDWGDVYFIVAKAGYFYAYIFLFYTFFFLFAVVNILTGVFVEKAVCAAQPDMEARILEKRKEAMAQTEELKQVISAIDVDGDGSISSMEFYEFMKNENFAAYLSTFGLEVNDARMFFELLAGIGHKEVEDIQVDIDTFVEGCLNMKGNASSVDMQKQLAEIHELREKVDHIEKSVHSSRDHVAKACTAEIAKLMAVITKNNFPRTVNASSAATVGDNSTARLDEGVGVGPSLGGCNLADTRALLVELKNDMLTQLAPEVAASVVQMVEPQFRASVEKVLVATELKNDVLAHLVPEVATSVVQMVEPEFRASVEKILVATRPLQNREFIQSTLSSSSVPYLAEQRDEIKGTTAVASALPKIWPSAAAVPLNDHDFSEETDLLLSACNAATMHSVRNAVDSTLESLTTTAITANGLLVSDVGNVQSSFHDTVQDLCSQPPTTPLHGDSSPLLEILEQYREEDGNEGQCRAFIARADERVESKDSASRAVAHVAVLSAPEEEDNDELQITFDPHLETQQDHTYGHQLRDGRHLGGDHLEQRHRLIQYQE